MKTKIKKILSVALPIIGLGAALTIATPFIVSCSNGSESEKPSNPENGNGGTTPIQTIKSTPIK